MKMRVMAVLCVAEGVLSEDGLRVVASKACCSCCVVGRWSKKVMFGDGGRGGVEDDEDEEGGVACVVMVLALLVWVEAEAVGRRMMMMEMKVRGRWWCDGAARPWLSCCWLAMVMEVEAVVVKAIAEKAEFDEGSDDGVGGGVTLNPAGACGYGR